MAKNIRISYHINNCSDMESRNSIRLKTETTSITQTTSEYPARYAEGIARQTVQKMWQIQLPLCQRTRARKLLSFRQYARQESYHDLCFSQESRQGQKSFEQLSDYSKHSRRDQHHQSRSPRPKGDSVKKEYGSQSRKILHHRWCLSLCCQYGAQLLGEYFSPNSKRERFL